MIHNGSNIYVCQIGVTKYATWNGFYESSHIFIDQNTLAKYFPENKTDDNNKDVMTNIQVCMYNKRKSKQEN